jgi:hypothetical protein
MTKTNAEHPLSLAAAVTDSCFVAVQAALGARSGRRLVTKGESLPLPRREIVTVPAGGR